MARPPGARCMSKRWGEIVVALILPFGWLVFVARSRVVRAFARGSTCF